LKRFSNDRSISKSLHATPAFILIFAALWIGLTLAEKQTERHVVSKDALNNITFYSILAYVIGGRLLFVFANLSAFAPSPLASVAKSGVSASNVPQNGSFWR